jgi:hypothetical protein
METPLKTPFRHQEHPGEVVCEALLSRTAAVRPQYRHLCFVPVDEEVSIFVTERPQAPAPRMFALDGDTATHVFTEDEEPADARRQANAEDTKTHIRLQDVPKVAYRSVPKSQAIPFGRRYLFGGFYGVEATDIVRRRIVAHERRAEELLQFDVLLSQLLEQRNGVIQFGTALARFPQRRAEMRDEVPDGHPLKQQIVKGAPEEFRKPHELLWLHRSIALLNRDVSRARHQESISRGLLGYPAGFPGILNPGSENARIDLAGVRRGDLD